MEYSTLKPWQEIGETGIVHDRGKFVWAISSYLATQRSQGQTIQPGDVVGNHFSGQAGRQRQTG